MSFKWVWKTETPPKVQFLLWLCLHDSLPTTEVLSSRGLILDPMCKMCNRDYETIKHLLKGCEVTHNFWQQLQTPYYTRNSFTLPLKEWIEANCKDELNATVKGMPWKILFPMALWQLWLHKNNFVFRTGTMDHQLWKECLQYSTEFYSIGLEAKIKQSKTSVPLGWKKPPRGWMKLNSDGSVLRNLGGAGGGGLIRDHDGS